MGAERSLEEARLDVENVGGIDETSVTFVPGVTVLAGRNATNRTSLLQAIMAALGNDDVSVKADAEAARVALTVDGETYTRSLERRPDGLSTAGDPYLEDSTLADLFALLLESNEARRAVATDADLRDIIMRPIDTEELAAEIDRLLERRREVTDELEELDELKARLPSLEADRTRLEDRIEAKREELRGVEEELAARDVDVERPHQEQAALEETLAELREKRSTLEDVRYELDTEEDGLDSLRAERRELREELDGLSEAPVEELEAVESDVDRLRTRKRELDAEINELQSVVRFNEEMLDEADADLLASLGDDADEDGSVTDELVADGTVTCWTCGSDVDPDRIEATIEKLRELSREKLAAGNEIDDELDALEERRRELEEQRRRSERLQRRRSELEEEIRRTQENVEELSDRKAALREEIAEIETEVESMEDDAYREVLEGHKEANSLEYDLGKLEGEIERVASEIETIEERLDRESELEARREEIDERIEELRTRIERIERQAIGEFNDHMDEVLELLEYRNIERIWLERLETEVREGRRTVTKSVFELHVVRKTDGGATYEDTVDNLSESEREVTGVIFALAGYLAHEVYETVPFMLLDSLEAIDSERIATLVDYVSEYSPYLVVALLPEDAAALDDDYRYVTEI